MDVTEVDMAVRVENMPGVVENLCRLVDVLSGIVPLLEGVVRNTPPPQWVDVVFCGSTDEHYIIQFPGEGIQPRVAIPIHEWAQKGYRIVAVDCSTVVDGFSKR